jgi:hypothetical protein
MTPNLKKSGMLHGQILVYGCHGLNPLGGIAQYSGVPLCSDRFGMESIVRAAREALENPSHPRENSSVIAAADWSDGQQAARIR